MEENKNIRYYGVILQPVEPLIDLIDRTGIPFLFEMVDFFI